MNYKLLLLLFVFTNGFSQNAILDATFGVNGKVTTSLVNINIKINSMEIQSDGKILTCGNINSYLGFVLVRYNVDGTLDTSFGNQGYVVNNDFYQIRQAKLKIQSDGKIVVSANRRTNELSGEDLFVVRYESTGIKDITFGVNGYFISTTCDEPADLVIQSDGKIVVATYDERKILRLTNVGELDSSFGNNGIVNLNAIGANEFVTDIKIQNNGKIIICGGTDLSESVEQWNGYLLRLNSDGIIDTSYGINGSIISDFNGRDVFSSINIYDDSIVVTGYSFGLNNTAKVILAKYYENGIFDSTFGIDGKVITQTSNPNLHDLCIDSKLQNDGKIICIGQNGPFSNPTPFVSNFLLLRYNSDGTLDTTFSSTGYLTINFNSDYNFGTSVAIQSDDKIVVGGYSYIPNISNFALARYTFENLASNSFSNENRLSFFPNPVNDYVTLEKEITSAIIYSIDGKKIEANYLNNKLDVSSLKKGIFFIVGKNDAGKSFENKLIKN